MADDAQYICDTLSQCFTLDVGTHCARDIMETTSDNDIRQCAGCYEEASCDEIGEPGVAGVCDDACSAALFEGG